MLIDLSLTECEALLLLYRGRERQQLGYADSARQKITKARNEILGIDKYKKHGSRG